MIARKSSYKIELAKPSLKEIGTICFNGSSDMVSNLAGGVSVLFMNHLAFRCYGEVGVSSLSVVTFLQFLIEAVFMGFTTAVEPIFSYHFGSGNISTRRKVYKYSIQYVSNCSQRQKAEEKRIISFSFCLAEVSYVENAL